MKHFHRSLIALPALLALWAPALHADHFSRAGSLLLLPEFDSRPGKQTFLTITNTNANAQGGTVRVDLVYVNGADTPQPRCSRIFRRATLTANDTLTVSSLIHAPGFSRGYCYAYASNPSTGHPIAFNHLVGQVHVRDSSTIQAYSINAIPFASAPALAEGQLTDVDFDGIRDLNGVEYVPAPAEILVPRFLGQSSGYTSELILLGLTGGTQFTTQVMLVVRNDNEEVFAADHSFACWEKVPLLAVSALFDNNFLLVTNHSPSESVQLREQGWFSVNGILAYSSGVQIADPAVLAVLCEGSTNSAAELPFATGTQANGDLLPTGLFGDFN